MHADTILHMLRLGGVVSFKQLNMPKKRRTRHLKCVKFCVLWASLPIIWIKLSEGVASKSSDGVSVIRVLMSTANHFVVKQGGLSALMVWINELWSFFTQLWLHFTTFHWTQMLLNMGTGIKTIETMHKPLSTQSHFHLLLFLLLWDTF